MKEGWYNSYYPDGKYMEVGRYKENKRNGEWIYHTEDREETRGFWRDGKKYSGEFWINVKKNGMAPWNETDDDLREYDEENEKDVYRGLFAYESGLWNGLGVLYWKNGNRRAEGLYKDGKRDG